MCQNHPLTGGFNGSGIHTHKQGSPIVESPYGGFHQWGSPKMDG